MKKIIIISTLLIISLLMIVGCSSKSNEQNKENNNDSNEVIETMKVTINGKQYTIQLEDNDTAKSFVNMLPQELNMSELNGNEKYVYMTNKSI